jgi:hypothetical protein
MINNNESLETKLVRLNDALIAIYKKRTGVDDDMQRIGLGVTYATEDVNKEPEKPKENSRAVIIDDDYSVGQDDFFIGVKCEKPIKLTFPKCFTEGKSVVVKIQSAPKTKDDIVSIVVEDENCIDDQPIIKLKDAYEVVQLLYVGNHWTIISYM